MAIKKQYMKTKARVKVTFRLPADAAPGAGSVALVGEFNNWNLYATPMERLKDGSFKKVLELEPGQRFEYRYLIDETKWENDWEADGYARSHYGNCDNSVVET
ncbi:isoamylase early set domain-containing protein [Desulfocurvus sp. DL9XJH121]